VSALATLRVCGGLCGGARDRKLARARRAVEVDEARHDERERQVKCRKGRLPAVCHAPASGAKHLRSREEVRRFVDLVFARSRATLQRDLLWICRRYTQFSGEAPALVTPEPRLASGADDG
jgi:hypothetical protein